MMGAITGGPEYMCIQLPSADHAMTWKVVHWILALAVRGFATSDIGVKIVVACTRKVASLRTVSMLLTCSYTTTARGVSRYTPAHII